MRIFTKLILSIFLVTLTVWPAVAQVNLLNSIKLPGTNDSVDVDTYNPGSMISTFLINASILAGIILLFLVIGGGFAIVTGGGDPEQVEKGKKTVVGALIGFIIIVSAYWIVQVIESITSSTEGPGLLEDKSAQQS